MRQKPRMLSLMLMSLISLNNLSCTRPESKSENASKSQNESKSQSDLEHRARKANKKDVLGTWRMTYQTVRPGMNTDSLFFADYQILQFSEDDYVKNLASIKRPDPEDVKMLLSAMPKTTTFSFVADGLLIVERSPQDISNIVISIITEDMGQPLRKGAPLLKKGELILSYLDPAKQLYMQRYFERINLE